MSFAGTVPISTDYGFPPIFPFNAENMTLRSAYYMGIHTNNSAFQPAGSNQLPVIVPPLGCSTWPDM